MSACGEIINKMKEGTMVDSILSGDVGCGKTIVACVCAFLMKENGYQTVVAAPTKVLAMQHFETFRQFLPDAEIELLTGATTTKEKNRVKGNTKSGNTQVLIGTHSVLSSEIVFNNLGLCIIDEEQKFGTEHKEGLRSFKNVHFLSMTATPIPRSLSKVLYGDSGDVIRIAGKPKNRLPVITSYTESETEAFDIVSQEVEKGHRAYIVCPFIEDSDSERFLDVRSVTSEKELFETYMKKNNLNISCSLIAGNMKNKEIEEEIRKFSEGESQILFSTSIVEVGVNVPEASCIVIINAERFGLSQLHQLRGRVGRSDIQSFCVLVSKHLTERIEIIKRKQDGFEIAEEDMRLRGPGDILGNDQSGANKTIDTILAYLELSLKVQKHFKDKLEC